MKLLSENAKTVKSEKLGWKNMILQLMPHTNNSLGKNLCPMANGCQDTCLVYTGRGMFPVVMNARKTRTEFFIKDKIGFVEQLMVEIDQLNKKHPKLCIRLNGFSDIQWENIHVNGKNIFEHLPDTKFYDYTKIPKRMSLNIPNYHLTFSGSNNNWWECEQILLDGKNVALVFEKELPKTFNSWVVIDGTEHDLRFLDGSFVVTGLTYKSVKNNDNKKLLRESKLVLG